MSNVITFGHADPPRHRGGGDHAGGGPGFDDVGRLRDRRLGRHDAAVRLHDPQRRAARRCVAQALLQRRQIVLHHRADIGVDHRGAGALVFADLRQDVRRQREYTSSGHAARSDLADAPLVRGIGVGLIRQTATASHRRPQRCARQPARPMPRRAAARPRRAGRSARRPRSAAGAAPAASAACIAGRTARDAQPPHLQHVAEAARGDQRGAGAACLPGWCWSATVVPCTTPLTAAGSSAGLREQLAQALQRLPRRNPRASRHLAGAHAAVGAPAARCR